MIKQCFWLCRQIWFLYQNVYADLLADLPSGDIDKLKGFYQKQV